MAVQLGDWDAQILSTRVICHTSGRIGSTNTSDNHWSIYFVLFNDRSVRFSMRAEPGYIDGALDIRSRDYTMTNSTIRNWDYISVKYFTVSSAYDYLVNRCHHNRYDMSGGGSGCRWWIYTVVSALASAGWIRSNAAMSLWPDLLFKYSNLQQRTPLEMVRGTFH